MQTSSTQATPRPSRRRVLDVAGRTLVVVGLLILGFVGYQLWGTGIENSRHQDSLEEAWESTTSTPGTSVPLTPPKAGEVVGEMSADDMNMSAFVVAGVGVEDLKKGPGWFMNTAEIGTVGNAAIAGHRTTFGAPFSDIDWLDPGDEITVTTPRGDFLYVVDEWFVVEPEEVWVLDDYAPGKATLTLVSCHPKLTSSDRIIVRATLDGDPAVPASPEVPASGDATATDAGLTGGLAEDSLTTGWWHDPSGAAPAVAWGAGAGALWLLGGLLARRTTRLYGKVALRSAGAAAAIVPLYFFYVNVSRLVPSNL